MSNICQWCSNTSSKIDSMEYQIEQLQNKHDEMEDALRTMLEAKPGHQREYAEYLAREVLAVDLGEGL